MKLFLLLTALLAGCAIASPDAADDEDGLCQDIHRSDDCEHRIACPYDGRRYGGLEPPHVPIHINGRTCSFMSHNETTSIWCCQ